MGREKKTVHFGKPIAILVDGAFFLKRYRVCFKNGKNDPPAVVAKNMYTMLMRHVENEELYRIFYYDCPPLEKKAHYPVSNKALDFSKSQVASFKNKFLLELVKLRKVALRLGDLSKKSDWVIRSQKAKELLKGKINVSDLTDDDFYYDIKQKGVDIRIGVDIASLAYKKSVNRIILVSGDSDFVPAAKLARREGIDFVLDPMWQQINEKLFEHIDGLKSTCDKPKFGIKKITQKPNPSKATSNTVQK